MTVSRIRRVLEQALLRNKEMSEELYAYDLEEITQDLIQSMKDDNDAFIFSVSARDAHVAMILIEQPDIIYRNEEARARLQILWPKAYAQNIKLLIPDFALQLANNELPINGVKIVDT